VRLTWRRGRRGITFRYHVEADDAPDRDGARTFRDRFTVEVPGDVDRIHPDLLALSAYLAVRPFTGPRLTFPTGISPLLAERLRPEAGPVDPGLEPRPIPGEGTPALAYSGGVDSTAALTVLPDDAEAVHLLRVVPGDIGLAVLARRMLRPGRPRMRSAAALAAIERLSAMGRTTHVVPSDLEFVRYPIGFPTDVANAIPALLMADGRRYDSISFGTVFESAYRVGKLEFTDYTTTDHHRYLGGLFAAVGVPFHQVTAGVSEVGTTMIVGASPYAAVAQSCLRGGPGTPCRQCPKCFRKTLLEAAVAGTQPDDALLDRLFSRADVRAKLTARFVKHENVFAYATSGYDGEHRLMQLLRRRVRGDTLPVGWMEHWYPPAAGLLPEHRRDEAAAAIAAVIPAMSPEEQAQAEAWDLGSALDTDEYRRRRAELVAALGE
jgi:hypothetical protein